MWGSSGRRRGPPKKTSSKDQRPISIKRVNAEIKLSQAPGTEGSLVSARLFLNDFTPRTVGLFSAVSVLVGEEVSLTIDKPKRFYCRGKIRSCQYLEASTFSDQSFNFRILIEFIFDSLEDEEMVRKYCEEIQVEYLGYNNAA